MRHEPYKKKTISVRVTSKMFEKIEDYCNINNISQSNFLRKAINDKLKKLFKWGKR